MRKTWFTQKEKPGLHKRKNSAQFSNQTKEVLQILQMNSDKARTEPAIFQKWK